MLRSRSCTAEGKAWASEAYKGAARRHLRPNLIRGVPGQSHSACSFLPVSLPAHDSAQTIIMDALRLRKKFPEVSQDEMFDLISRFKYVFVSYKRG